MKTNVKLLVSNHVARKIAQLHHPALSQALTAFTNMSQLKEAHALIIVSGLAHRVFTITRLLACAAIPHSGDIAYAKTLFHHVQTPTLFMYNTMMRAFSQSNEPLECVVMLYVHMLRAGILPDNFTFPFLIRSSSSALLLGQQLHAHITKFGLHCDVFVVNNTIGMYSRCGELNCARRLFDESWSLVDVVSWTTLITGHCSLGESEVARQFFDRMPCKNIVSWNAMISGYVHSGKIEKARKLFDEMPERDAASWSAMISGYSQGGMCREALGLFKQMVGAMVVPNEPALVSAVSACAQLRALEEGIWLHGYIEHHKFEINVTLGTVLLDMYGKCGNVEKALQVFNCMPEKNVFSWNSMIVAFAFNGCGRQALSLFWQMHTVGPPPNGVSFIAVLTGCSHSGLVDEGRWIFNLMTQEYQIKPQMEHYGCMVDLLGRAGLIKEALEFVEGMPMEPHPGLWGALVGACRIHGEVELGKQLGRHLINMEPHHGGRYALLSNIFAAANRWDDMAMVRNMLKERKVFKTAGNSIVKT
ncbi:hypothetical protein L1049_002791 [Liquidambar formosana]|uniref:Chlororespiratory reduction 4 n=1 Tax=Liquidambar formosana TaxID=63359 RepID=A0AAP0NKZ3_LIQFO